MSAADLILVNATVVTVDPQFSVAEAIAVHDGRVVAVGTDAEIVALASADTETVDLHGATVLPGFVEAHAHPTSEMRLIGPGAVDIRAAVCPTAGDVLGRLREAVVDAGPGDWVFAFGWDPLLVPDLPRISGALLDEISPEVPLSVMHYSVHSSWANSAALARLGITSETPDPPGSTYVRDAHGRLTGEGREIPASMILGGPQLDVQEDTFAHHLDFTLHRFARAGVTTVADLAFEPDAYPAVTDYFQEHPAPVRMRTYEKAGVRTVIPHPDHDDPMIRPVGVKVWSDGSPWIGNIETSFEYQPSPETEAIGVHPGHRGCSNYTPAELLEICRTYMAQGWQIACHVHGDVAVDTVLDTFEAIQVETGRNDLRLRMEHCGSITEPQVARAHRLGVTISFFVAHLHYYGEVLRGLFGPRADEWTPVGSAAASGMPFSLHNDPPVTPENPLLNIQTAVTRTSRAGARMGGHLRIGVADAIRAQTIWAAWQLHSEHEIGSIEPGKLADLVVLSRNPLEASPGDIAAIEVVDTWLAGRRVGRPRRAPGEFQKTQHSGVDLGV